MNFIKSELEDICGVFTWCIFIDYEQSLCSGIVEENKQVSEGKIACHIELSATLKCDARVTTSE